MDVSSNGAELNQSRLRRPIGSKCRLNRNVHQLFVESTTREAQHRSHRHQRAQREPDIASLLHAPPLLEASFDLARLLNWGQLKFNRSTPKKEMLWGRQAIGPPLLGHSL